MPEEEIELSERAQNMIALAANGSAEEFNNSVDALISDIGSNDRDVRHIAALDFAAIVFEGKRRIEILEES